MYSFDSRVRYSEIGEDRALTLYGLVNYFQDCSTFHSEAVSRGMEVLQNEGRAWVLVSWQICVNRYPMLGEHIKINTWPYDFKGFRGERNYTMLTPEGEMLAYASSMWVFVDALSGTMLRIPKEEWQVYPCEEKLDMEYAPRKIEIPEEHELKEPFEVRRSHLDTNHHVNNAQYIKMAKEYIPRSCQPEQIRVEYKKQAVLGNAVIPLISQSENRYIVALCDDNKKPYAVVEFSGDLSGTKQKG